MGKMRRRKITLADGRYLIFYTFEDAEPPPPPPAEKTDGARSQSEDQAKSKEVRRV